MTKLAAFVVAVLLLSAGVSDRWVGSSSPGVEPAQIVEELETTQPNIVLIKVDDASINMVEDALSHGWMPALQDGIVSAGIKFERYYASYPLCCPERATTFTGQYAHVHGVMSNLQSGGGGIWNFNDLSTLATWLQAAGYYTGLYGKYLNGAGDNTDPNTPRDDPTYMPPGWNDYHVSFGISAYNWTQANNGVEVKTYGSTPADYQTDVLATMAADFITAREVNNDAQPFFLYITPGAPHQEGPDVCTLNNGAISTTIPAQRHVGLAASLPLPQPPDFNETDIGTCPTTGPCTDKPRFFVTGWPLLTPAQITCVTSIYRARVESLMAVNDLVGKILGRLNFNEELDNTLVVFTSDNGYLMGEKRAFHKAWPWEGSIHLPLYMRGPGIPAGVTTTRFALTNDIAPTFVELAGATAGLVMNGRSLTPLFADQSYLPWRKRIFGEVKSGVGSGLNYVRTDSLDTTAPSMGYTKYWTSGVSTDVELYDYALDPYALVSKHADPTYATKKAALDSLLTSFQTCTGSTCQSLEDQ